MDDLSKLLTEHTKQVVAETLRQIAPKLCAAEPYTKASPPPGKSARWLGDVISSIPGSYRVGRTWMVSRADFDRWVVSTQPARASTPAGEDDADLQALGFTPKGGTK